MIKRRKENSGKEIMTLFPFPFYVSGVGISVRKLLRIVLFFLSIYSFRFNFFIKSP